MEYTRAFFSLTAWNSLELVPDPSTALTMDAAILSGWDAP